MPVPEKDVHDAFFTGPHDLKHYLEAAPELGNCWQEFQHALRFAALQNQRDPREIETYIEAIQDKMEQVLKYPKLNRQRHLPSSIPQVDSNSLEEVRQIRRDYPRVTVGDVVRFETPVSFPGIERGTDSFTFGVIDEVTSQFYYAYRMKTALCTMYDPEKFRRVHDATNTPLRKDVDLRGAKIVGYESLPEFLLT